MNFELSEEQQLIQAMVKEFAAADVAPIAAEIDRDHRFPEELLPMMGKLGLMGVPFAEEFGGAGADYHELHDRGRGARTGLCKHFRHRFGPRRIGSVADLRVRHARQKEKYLFGLASGEKLGAFALTEPGAGTDAAGGQTTAVLDGDEYVLNGSKIFITNGGYADVYVVTAMTDPTRGTRGYQRLHRGEGCSRFLRRGEGAQDGDQGVQHDPALLLGLPHPEGRPSRKGRKGVQDRHADP